MEDNTLLFRPNCISNPGIFNYDGKMSCLLLLVFLVVQRPQTWPESRTRSKGILFFSRSVMSNSLPPHGLQHAKFPCPSLSLGVCSNSGPLSSWCHRTISFSVAPFSSCLQSFPGSGSLPVSQLFASGGQSAGTSASSSVLSVNIQSWFPLGLTALISLHKKSKSQSNYQN